MGWGSTTGWGKGQGSGDPCMCLNSACMSLPDVILVIWVALEAREGRRSP